MMVVEDEEPCRRALQMLLESRGYAVRAVASAEEALADLSSDATAPAFMVVDVDLPGICGLDLVERVQADGRGIQTMLLTAADRTLMESFATKHDVPYFAKPLDVQGFLRCVAQTFAGKQPSECRAAERSATACRGNHRAQVL